MKSTSPTVAILTAAILTFFGTTATAADAWLNSPVLPKSENILITVERTIVGTITDVAWPAVVSRREGQWLWLEQTEAEHGHSLSGWINTADVITVEKAGDYYTSQLTLRPSPYLHWLRGIVWESQGESAVAKLDYEEALMGESESRPDLLLGDAHVRLAKILAAEALQLKKSLAAGRSGSSDQATTNAPQAESLPPPNEPSWEKHFELARAARRQARLDISRVDFEHAETVRKHFAHGCLKTDFETAATKYRGLIVNHPQWSQPHYGFGQLLLTRALEPAADTNKKQSSATLARAHTANEIADLQEAATAFNRALRLHPKNMDALIDRAEVYLELSLPSEALASAHKACSLCYYRRTHCLEILARAYSALQVYDQAAYFAQKGAEFASEPAEQARLLADCETYSNHYGRLHPELIASNDAGDSSLDGLQPKSFGSTETAGPGGQSKRTGSGTPFFLRTFVPRSLSADNR